MAGGAQASTMNNEQPARFDDSAWPLLVVQLAFAHAMQPVFYAMSGVLAVTFVVTLLWLPRGKLSEPSDLVGAIEPEPTEVEA